VEDELLAPPQRRGDHQQRQRHPLRLDLDAPPEHDPEDQGQVDQGPDQEEAVASPRPDSSAESLQLLTTTTAAISTVTPRGSAFVPTAARVCLPASPSTSTRRSEAALITVGWS